jgi:carbon-monoxide dehydrogenase medium subunit
VAHADPSADYLPALVALDALIETVGPEGRREIPAAKFLQGFLTTVLSQGEIVTAIILPPGPAQACTRYEKFARVEGDFATVSVAVALWTGGVRIALGGVGPVPVRSLEGEAKLVAGRLSDAAVDAAGALLAASSDPIDDVRGSADYRRLIIPHLLKRAIRAAQAREAR